MVEVKAKEIVKEEKKNEEFYSLVEIPTQTSVAFKDNVTGDVLDQLQLLKRIAEDISYIKRRI